MADTVETLLVRNLHEVFGEPDAAQRRAAIAEIWAPGGVFVDAQGRFVGPDALNDVVSQLYARFPGFVFTAVGSPEAFNGIGRLAWGHGPVGDTPTLSGVDIVTVEAGRIVSLYTFIDRLPAA